MENTKDPQKPSTIGRTWTNSYRKPDRIRNCSGIFSKEATGDTDFKQDIYFSFEKHTTELASHTWFCIFKIHKIGTITVVKTAHFKQLICICNLKSYVSFLHQSVKSNERGPVSHYRAALLNVYSYKKQVTCLWYTHTQKIQGRRQKLGVSRLNFTFTFLKKDVTLPARRTARETGWMGLEGDCSFVFYLFEQTEV